MFSELSQVQRQILHDPLMWNLKKIVTRDWEVAEVG